MNHVEETIKQLQIRREELAADRKRTADRAVELSTERSQLTFRISEINGELEALDVALGVLETLK